MLFVAVIAFVRSAIYSTLLHSRFEAHLYARVFDYMRMCACVCVGKSVMALCAEMFVNKMW